jgi:hypothetical protein
MSYLYVLLKFEGMFLFIPQDEVQAVEIIPDVHITPTTMGAIGWFTHDHGHGQNAPVFCLAEDLSLLSDLPDNRQYFALLKAPDVPVGITGDDIENIDLRHEHLYLQSLPPIMKTTHSPISQLVVYKDQIGCVCTGPALVEYLIYLATLCEQSES